jgi:hypothetical protein
MTNMPNMSELALDFLKNTVVRYTYCVFIANVLLIGVSTAQETGFKNGLVILSFVWSAVMAILTVRREEREGRKENKAIVVARLLLAAKKINASESMCVFCAAAYNFMCYSPLLITIFLIPVDVGVILTILMFFVMTMAYWVFQASRTRQVSLDADAVLNSNSDEEDDNE